MLFRGGRFELDAWLLELALTESLPIESAGDDDCLIEAEECPGVEKSEGLGVDSAEVVPDGPMSTDGSTTVSILVDALYHGVVSVPVKAILDTSWPWLCRIATRSSCKSSRNPTNERVSRLSVVE